MQINVDDRPGSEPPAAIPVELRIGVSERVFCEGNGATAHGRYVAVGEPLRTEYSSYDGMKRRSAERQAGLALSESKRVVRHREQPATATDRINKC